MAAVNLRKQNNYHALKFFFYQATPKLSLQISSV